MQEYTSHLKLHILVLNLMLIILIFKITKSYYYFKLLKITQLFQFSN